MDKTKYIYPAIFSKDDDGYSVSFPDLDGCFTCGDTLEGALYMAIDASTGWVITALKLNEEIPKPTDIKNIKLKNENEFTTLINIDLIDYYKKNNNKSIKKTLTIPQWLNEMAVQENINFSAILQEALKEKLNITR